MSITISYNGYEHPTGEVAVSITRRSLLTAARTVYAETVQINLNGTLVGDGVTSIDTQLIALATAYAVDGKDFVMQDDGPPVLALATSLASADTLGGIRVMRRPSLADGRNAAYVTFMNYQITLEATVAKPAAFTALASFHESIHFSGGGRRYGMLETRVGRPQRQLLTQNTIYRAVQSGQAVGLYRKPPIPLPLWPAWRIDNPDVTRMGGRMIGEGDGQTYMDFGVRWRYKFESPILLIGSPATWGVA